MLKFFFSKRGCLLAQQYLVGGFCMYGGQEKGPDTALPLRSFPSISRQDKCTSDHMWHEQWWLPNQRGSAMGRQRREGRVREGSTQSLVGKKCLLRQSARRQRCVPVPVRGWLQLVHKRYKREVRLWQAVEGCYYWFKWWNGHNSTQSLRGGNNGENDVMIMITIINSQCLVSTKCQALL